MYRKCPCIFNSSKVQCCHLFTKGALWTGNSFHTFTNFLPKGLYILRSHIFLTFRIGIDANLNVYVVVGEAGHLLSNWFASTNTDGVCYIEVSLLISSLCYMIHDTWNHIGYLYLFYSFMYQAANLDCETNLKISKALEKTWDYLTPEKASEIKGLHLFFEIEYLCILFSNYSYFYLLHCRDAVYVTQSTLLEL